MTNPRQPRELLVILECKGVSKHIPKALFITLEPPFQNSICYNLNPQSLLFPTASFNKFLNEQLINYWPKCQLILP